MAARRGKSQARRNNGNGPLPGWAWMVLGIVLTVAVVLALPYLKGDKDSEGFLRPKPNPEATPAVASDAEAVADEPLPAPKPTQYDFYTMLPADEVAMTDAELAATARAEEERRARDAADVAAMEKDTVDLSTAPAPAPSIEPTGDTPYVLQAGAFGAAGDAEALKARIALLGLSARVESAEVRGQTVYRVRMGPYRTASELSEAKRKLTGGGLPALAIRAK